MKFARAFIAVQQPSVQTRATYSLSVRFRATYSLSRVSPPRTTIFAMLVMARKRLGARIRARRSELGFSQDELAHRCGLHRTYLGGIERGERNPSLVNLLKI